jgi:hypothetical protein
MFKPPVRSKMEPIRTGSAAQAAVPTPAANVKPTRLRATALLHRFEAV